MDEDTYDIQHDLAMFFADGETEESHPLNKAYADELRRRNAPLPIDCRWIHNPYAPFKSKLIFSLEPNKDAIKET